MNGAPPLGVPKAFLIQPVSAAPSDWPEFHLINQKPKTDFKHESLPTWSNTLWHSDVTFDEQPPGLTTLLLYDSPHVGGDNGFADLRRALRICNGSE